MAPLLGGCNAHAVRSLQWGLPQHTAFQYSFHTEHHLSTVFIDPPPPATGEEGTRKATEASLQSWSLVLDGQLTQSLARVFRDGTWGQLVRITAARGEENGPRGAIPIEAEGLVGKSVVVRGWPSGETLEMAGYAQLGGAGRLGEVWFDLFPQLTVRLPRTLPQPGSPPPEEPSNYTLRAEFTSQAAVEQAWSLKWTGATQAPCPEGECLSLTYQGTIVEVDKNDRPDRKVDASGTGTVEGTLLLASLTHRLIRHEYRVKLTRELTTFGLPPARGEEAPPRIRLRTTDEATTVLQRIP